SPEQEEHPQDSDPYAGTIFARQPVVTEPPTQKNFASENEPTIPMVGTGNSQRGNYQTHRSNKRTKITNLRKKEIRIAPTSQNLEEALRYLPTPDQLPKPKAKSPAFIRNMLTDFSRDLGDHDHSFSNISQAARIYRHSGMSEEDFIQALYEARAT